MRVHVSVSRRSRGGSTSQPSSRLAVQSEVAFLASSTTPPLSFDAEAESEISGSTPHNTMHPTAPASSTHYFDKNPSLSLSHPQDRLSTGPLPASFNPYPEPFTLPLPQLFPSLDYTRANAYTPDTSTCPYAVTDATSNPDDGVLYVLTHQSPHSYQGYVNATPRHAPPFTSPPPTDGFRTFGSTAHTSGPSHESMQPGRYGGNHSLNASMPSSEAPRVQVMRDRKDGLLNASALPGPTLRDSSTTLGGCRSRDARQHPYPNPSPYFVPEGSASDGFLRSRMGSGQPDAVCAHHDPLAVDTTTSYTLFAQPAPGYLNVDGPAYPVSFLQNAGSSWPSVPALWDNSGSLSDALSGDPSDPLTPTDTLSTRTFSQAAWSSSPSLGDPLAGGYHLDDTHEIADPDDGQTSPHSSVLYGRLQVNCTPIMITREARARTTGAR
ncbi:hypothetical protein C8Q79DRAFT_247932 [Trametes meyenii]|nr:hypothetical protein C8Q79DRAFT_247932 [Trametes meyenii]